MIKISAWKQQTHMYLIHTASGTQVCSCIFSFSFFYSTALHSQMICVQTTNLHNWLVWTWLSSVCTRCYKLMLHILIQMHFNTVLCSCYNQPASSLCDIRPESQMKQYGGVINITHLRWKSWGFYTWSQAQARSWTHRQTWCDSHRAGIQREEGSI